MADHSDEIQAKNLKNIELLFCSVNNCAFVFRFKPRAAQLVNITIILALTSTSSKDFKWVNTVSRYKFLYLEAVFT